MFERYICDFVHHQDHRIEMTEVVVTGRWEAYEWLEEIFLEPHRERSTAPDLLRQRKDDEVLATWRSMRKLNADLEAGELRTVAEDALFITSQMERLEKGKAGPLKHSSTVSIIERVSRETENRSMELNIREAREAALRLQDAFDAGDFASAQEAALEVNGITRVINLDE